MRPAPAYADRLDPTALKIKRSRRKHDYNSGLLGQRKPVQERQLRATTALNKMLAVPGAGLVGVKCTPAGIEV